MKSAFSSCLNCEDPAARRLAFTELKKVTGEEIDYDPDARAEKRRAAGREVRAKLAQFGRVEHLRPAGYSMLGHFSPTSYPGAAIRPGRIQSKRTTDVKRWQR